MTNENYKGAMPPYNPQKTKNLKAKNYWWEIRHQYNKINNYAGQKHPSVEEGKASSSVDSRLKISGMTGKNYREHLCKLSSFLAVIIKVRVEPFLSQQPLCLNI